MIKVSVIVPVYNVEAYLDKCLKTLVNQTLEEIEIIVVNDGATDRSQEIIDKYAKESHKIKGYIKENGGLSDARNYGLQYAKGEYIGFVDSDDFVELNMYALLYEKAKKEGSDIVECNLRHTYDRYEDIEIGDEIKDKNELIKFGRSVVWNKIYKRDWLLGLQVTFPKGLIYEDVAFFMKLVPSINRYDYVKPALIHYVQRRSSLNNLYSEKTLHIIDILKDVYDYYCKEDYLEAYKEALEFLFIRILLCSSFSRMCKIKDRNARKSVLQKNWECLVNYFPQWKRNETLKGLTSLRGIYMKSVNQRTYKLYCFVFPIIYHLKSLKKEWA